MHVMLLWTTVLGVSNRWQGDNSEQADLKNTFWKQFLWFGGDLRGVGWGFLSLKVCLAPLQKIVGDFCCIRFGGLCLGFSWRISLGTVFPQKLGEKIRRQNPQTKKKRRLKIKIRKKSVLPKTNIKDPQAGNRSSCALSRSSQLLMKACNLRTELGHLLWFLLEGEQAVL